jgi:hypothetical protein
MRFRNQLPHSEPPGDKRVNLHRRQGMPASSAKRFEPYLSAEHALGQHMVNRLGLLATEGADVVVPKVLLPQSQTRPTTIEEG